MSEEKPYWEGKKYSFSVIKNVNIFHVIKRMTRKTLTVCSATVLCMLWEISAEETLNIQKRA